MDSSMTDNNQIYILHVTPVAGVESQYTLTIESVPIIHDEATYHETQNDNQPVYLPISTTLSNQLQTFESHQALSYTSDPPVCIATASYCPATSFALPPSQPELTSPPCNTEASCSTQCIPSTSTQIFHQPISQPESDHVKNTMNKQSGKSTFDGYKNEKNLVVSNGERQHTFHFEDCGKLLPTKTRLDDHLKSSHTGERSYTCDFVNDSNKICGKTFHKKHKLNRHVKLHGEKKHICSICSKGFTTSRYLKTHFSTHFKEKKHICSICTKRFRRKDHLNNHIRTHTGEKKHTCSICSKGFTTSRNLQKHIRRHTGNKRHICSICTREFRRKNHLNNHIRIHRNLKGKNLSVKTTNN